ncbi:MAG: phosphoenolpyruvate--protein phosphotransferase [Bdellovibrio bacteriovorus]
MTKDRAKSRQRLTALTQIVREVDAAPDLNGALRVLVERTRAVMGSDVCTVYFTDPAQRRHVVAATEGLSSGVVGKVQFGFGRGLIGQVAEDCRPLNLDRVPPDLDQDFVLQAGGGTYQGFLGVPVTHKAQVQGVLVVRQRQARRFDDADEAFLGTLAAQLGGAIAYAKARGEWCPLCRADDASTGQIEGLPGAPGLAIGLGVAAFGPRDVEGIPQRAVEDMAAEEARLRQAISTVGAEMAALTAQLAGTLSQAELALFDAYGLLLDGPEILEGAASLVREGDWAPSALSRTIETYARRFDAMEDPYLRERATDIRALGERVLAHLLGETPPGTRVQGPAILVGQHLSAVDIGQAQAGQLVGIISGDGSSLSHAAILARSLGIPAVMGISELPLARLDGQELVVDGGSGRVHLRPTPRVRQAFETSIQNQRLQAQALERARGLAAVTQDGVKVALFVNAGLSTDLGTAAASGAAGIGLFRSELPFMLFNRLPSEIEQMALYRQALEAMAPRPVTLRTLDAGGDKSLPYLAGSDLNPELGARGIRYLLDHPEIFLTQLRAALRADLGLGNLRLLLPMISGLDELDQALTLLGQAMEQLATEGHPVARPPVGVMIEVPAAVYQVQALARQADFLSVGTNDLAQYLLATDRNNPRVSSRLDPAHPAVLLALRQVVEAAHRSRRVVTVCGEAANEPAMALLLLGMGFDGLSMNAGALPAVTWAVRGATSERMRALAQEALQCERPDAVRRLLDAAHRDIGLDRLLAAPGARDGAAEPTRTGSAHLRQGRSGRRS